MGHRVWSKARRARLEDGRDGDVQQADCSRQRAVELSSHRASGHLAAPSLGHYAALSSVVRGRA